MVVRVGGLSDEFGWVRPNQTPSAKACHMKMRGTATSCPQPPLFLITPSPKIDTPQPRRLTQAPCVAAGRPTR